MHLDFLLTFLLLRHPEYGYEICAGASAVLLAASLPRIRKGPVPAALTGTSLLSGGYYGKQGELLVLLRPLEEATDLDLRSYSIRLQVPLVLTVVSCNASSYTTSRRDTS